MSVGVNEKNKTHVGCGRCPEVDPTISVFWVSMNTYGRVREERLAEAVERAGKAILQPECLPAVYRLAAGAERENATYVESAGCVSQKLVAGAGFEPATFGL